MARAAVSKTAGRGFESSHSCHPQEAAAGIGPESNLSEILEEGTAVEQAEVVESVDTLS